MEKNFDWAKKNFLPKLFGYDFNFRYFDDGDFGSLNQIEFDSAEYSGAIDFWGMNWLGIFVWDKIREEEKINLMFSPEQEKEKEEIFFSLETFLVRNN